MNIEDVKMLDFILPTNNLDLLEILNTFKTLLNSNYEPFFLILIDTNSGNIDDCFSDFEPFISINLNQQVSDKSFFLVKLYKNSNTIGLNTSHLNTVLKKLDDYGLIYSTPIYHLNLFIIEKFLNEYIHEK
jgi:hypothetical protein